jgi:hypothetical protein
LNDGVGCGVWTSERAFLRSDVVLRLLHSQPVSWFCHCFKRVASGRQSLNVVILLLLTVRTSPCSLEAGAQGNRGELCAQCSFAIWIWFLHSWRGGPCWHADRPRCIATMAACPFLSSCPRCGGPSCISAGGRRSEECRWRRVSVDDGTAV